MNKPSTFNEAFKILDRAIAEQPRGDLSSLIGGEMRLLKAVIADDTSELAGIVRDLSVIGAQQSIDLAKQIDEQVRLNPALAIGGFAAAAFAVGLLASASHYQKGQA